MALYDQVASLDCRIDDFDLELLERETSSDFTRTSTVVTLHGEGTTGRGEDVTYENDEHYAFVERSDQLSLAGEYTIDSLSEQLADTDLFFGAEPTQTVARNYRQWAFESAALDLALKQADTDLATRLERTYDPVRFVVSTRLDEPPTGERIEQWLRDDPSLEFKLDPTSAWTADTVDRLVETDAVRVLDLKGQYHGTAVDQSADLTLYERVVERFPDALIEDPELTDETEPLLEAHADRITWDYPIRGVEDITELPWKPTWLNCKPSRFGTVRSLFETLEYCEEHDIRLYGGGQFELGVGREHIHALASIFYPDGPNDVAPTGYNDPQPESELPSSPLTPPQSPRGLSWN